MQLILKRKDWINILKIIVHMISRVHDVYKDDDAAFKMTKNKTLEITMIILQILPRLLDKVHLRTGHCRGGNKAAMFSPN